MIRDGEDLRSDYETWVEHLFNKMARNIYEDKSIDYNSSWILEKFRPAVVYPHLYGDAIGEGLKFLLEQLFVVIVTEDEDIFEKRHFKNSTWMRKKLDNLKNGFDDLRKSINEYYSAWQNGM